MAWHEHLKTIHHHAARGSRAFLRDAIEHHPVIVTGLALIGGIAAFRTLAGTHKAPTTSTVSPTAEGGTST